MINQEQVNEAKEKFCNPNISLKEASEIAGLLGQDFENDEVAEPLLTNNPDLYNQLKEWNVVGECLSFHTQTFDKAMFDNIEDVLGVKVALQVYHFHLEERVKNKLPPQVFLPEKDLISKMKKEHFDKKPFLQFLDLHERAKYLLG